MLALMLLAVAIYFGNKKRKKAGKPFLPSVPRGWMSRRRGSGHLEKPTKAGNHPRSYFWKMLKHLRGGSPTDYSDVEQVLPDAAQPALAIPRTSSPPADVQQGDQRRSDGIVLKPEEQAHLAFTNRLSLGINGTGLAGADQSPVKPSNASRDLTSPKRRSSDIMNKHRRSGGLPVERRLTGLGHGRASYASASRTFGSLASQPGRSSSDWTTENSSDLTSEMVRGHTRRQSSSIWNVISVVEEESRSSQEKPRSRVWQNDTRTEFERRRDSYLKRRSTNRTRINGLFAASKGALGSLDETPRSKGSFVARRRSMSRNPSFGTRRGGYSRSSRENSWASAEIPQPLFSDPDEQDKDMEEEGERILNLPKYDRQSLRARWKRKLQRNSDGQMFESEILYDDDPAATATATTTSINRRGRPSLVQVWSASSIYEADPVEQQAQAGHIVTAGTTERVRSISPVSETTGYSDVGAFI